MFNWTFPKFPSLWKEFLSFWTQILKFWTKILKFLTKFLSFEEKMQRRWKFGLMEGSLAFPIIIAIAVFDHNHRDHPCNHHHLNHHKHCPHYPQHHNDLLVSCGTRVTRVGHGHNVWLKWKKLDQLTIINNVIVFVINVIVWDTYTMCG